MKKLMMITVLIILAMVSTLAQTSRDEQEILKIHNSLDQAFIKQDFAVFEGVMADDYVYTDPLGRTRNRAQNLEQIRKEWAETSYKPLAATSEDLKVKIWGDTALVTGKWTFSAVPTAVANAEPHQDWGRYTGVYERRGGKWLLVAEHFSEAPHDRKLMVEQVLKMGQAYAQIIKNQDAAALEKILAEDYLLTNKNGKVTTRAEELANYKERPVKLEIFEIADQKVRIVGNSAAVETGTIRYKGTNKDGKPIEGSERYTTTWTWRNMRWQIVADHVSAIKQP